MPRLTITLSEERHRALKEAAARRGTSVRAIIEESLDLAGIKTRESAAEILAAARSSAGLSEAEAVRVAVRETRAARRRRR